MSAPSYEPVVVEWLDAYHESATLSPDEMEGPVTLRTAGWLVRETPEFLSVAMEWEPKGNTFRDTTHIPRAYVKKVTYLRAGKRQRAAGRHSR